MRASASNATNTVIGPASRPSHSKNGRTKRDHCRAGETDGENASAKRGKIGLDFAFANTHFRAERGRKGHVDQKALADGPGPYGSERVLYFPSGLPFSPGRNRRVETDLGPLDDNRDVALRNQTGPASAVTGGTAAGPAARVKAGNCSHNSFAVDAGKRGPIHDCIRSQRSIAKPFNFVGHEPAARQVARCLSDRGRARNSRE